MSHFFFFFFRCLENVRKTSSNCAEREPRVTPGNIETIANVCVRIRDESTSFCFSLCNRLCNLASDCVQQKKLLVNENDRRNCHRRYARAVFISLTRTSRQYTFVNLEYSAVSLQRNARRVKQSYVLYSFTIRFEFPRIHFPSVITYDSRIVQKKIKSYNPCERRRKQLRREYTFVTLVIR